MPLAQPWQSVSDRDSPNPGRLRAARKFKFLHYPVEAAYRSTILSKWWHYALPDTCAARPASGLRVSHGDRTGGPGLGPDLPARRTAPGCTAYAVSGKTANNRPPVVLTTCCQQQTAIEISRRIIGIL